MSVAPRVEQMSANQPSLCMCSRAKKHAADSEKYRQRADHERGVRNRRHRQAP